MNERIRELAEQAELIQWDTLPSGAKTPDHESVVKAKKFAELIIREHLSLLTDCYRGTANAREWDNALLFLEKHIKEHWGLDA